jgi:hypothetical protein
MLNNFAVSRGFNIPAARVTRSLQPSLALQACQPRMRFIKEQTGAPKCAIQLNTPQLQVTHVLGSKYVANLTLGSSDGNVTADGKAPAQVTIDPRDLPLHVLTSARISLSIQAVRLLVNRTTMLDSVKAGNFLEDKQYSVIELATGLVKVHREPPVVHVLVDGT